MKPLRVDVILAFLLLTALLNACGGGSGNANSKAVADAPKAANENANTPKTNVEELGVLINVPYESEDIVWKDDASHKKLIAVLRFSTADCDKIVADAQKYRKPEDAAIQSESWFPDELVAQGDMSGDDTLKGISYGANAFLQEPFNEGSIIRIEGTNYFVLEASSK
jgi:hypothetical protein